MIDGIYFVLKMKTIYLGRKDAVIELEREGAQRRWNDIGFEIRQRTTI